MKVNQIYELLNSISGQITGAENIAVTDTASFISYGSTVFANENGVEQCYKALGDRIARTIVLYERLAKKKLIEKMDTITFGSAIQIIETKAIGDASENQSWVTGSSGFIEQQNPFEVIKRDETAVLCQYFSRNSTWEIDKKIYDIQLRTAFTSEVQMAAFVEMIFADMYNAMTLAENDLQHATLSASIASAIAKGTDETTPSPAMARNLLHEYNTNTNAGLTVSTALQTKEFLRFCAKEILLATKKMRDPSVFYNELGTTKWIESPQVVALTNYTTASDCYLSSDTYHKELVALPDYREVNFWQGQGKDSSFENVSKIMSKVYASDSDTVGKEVEQSGVIAFVCDPRRQGYLFDNIRTKSVYNQASECTDYFHKADQGFMINRARNGVVFYLAEV